MTIDQANVFLDELKNLSPRIRNFLEQIEILDARMTNITQQLNATPGSHDNKSKIEEMTVNKMEIEHNLLEHIYRSDTDRMQALAVSWKLPKIQGDIIRDRYIFNKSYEEIANYTKYSERQIYRFREDAVKNFAEKYTEMYENV